MLETHMRLESISLHGFKSFAEKTTVKVLPGVTGIVGPNGCGKSNISEAVRWALGEQSAKSLRGQRMEDLIFHGSASRKAVGLAEVELVFSNDGAVSVPWSEIAVGRRLYRTGESEYQLNKSACRLRDMLDLFAGTGANPRAYSVMDQDKLNHVLTAKPHERRVFIEEAAGIARYKQQRQETQGKLEATRQNLVRVRDVMDEVKRQLGSLERQAKKAQQYKTLQGEQRELGLALAAADYAALTAETERRAELATRVTPSRGCVPGIAAVAARAGSGSARSCRRASIAWATCASPSRRSRASWSGSWSGASRWGHRSARRRKKRRGSPRISVPPRSGRKRSWASGRLPRGPRRGGASMGERARAALAELEAAVVRQRAGLATERERVEALRLEQVRVAAERVDLMREAGELREREAQLGAARVSGSQPRWPRSERRPSGS